MRLVIHQNNVDLSCLASKNTIHDAAEIINSSPSKTAIITAGINHLSDIAKNFDETFRS